MWFNTDLVYESDCTENGNTEQEFTLNEIYKMFPEQILVLTNVKYENDTVYGSEIKSASVAFYGMSRYTAKAMEFLDNKEIEYICYSTHLYGARRWHNED